MVGLSLSFCLKDIAAGKVDRGDVTRLIAGTRITLATVEECFQDYMKVYWSEYSEGEMRKLYTWALGFMEQPRLKGIDPPSIHGGHWVLEDDEILMNFDCEIAYVNWFDHAASAMLAEVLPLKEDWKGRLWDYVVLNGDMFEITDDFDPKEILTSY